MKYEEMADFPSTTDLKGNEKRKKGGISVNGCPARRRL